MRKEKREVRERTATIEQATQARIFRVDRRAGIGIVCATDLSNVRLSQLLDSWMLRDRARSLFKTQAYYRSEDAILVLTELDEQGIRSVFGDMQSRSGEYRLEPEALNHFSFYNIRLEMFQR